MTAGLVVALAALLLAGDVPAKEAASADQRLGTRIVFHGWSPDGERLAYTRYERRPPRRRGRAVKERVRMLHRKVEQGRFAKVLRTRGIDDLAVWAQRNGFVTEPIEVTPLDERRYWFIAPEGVYELALAVGEVLAWELRFDGAVLHRHEFDTVYVGWTPALYLAPDRGHVAVVMQLDAGWVVDAGIWPIALPETVRERWRLLEQVPRPAPQGGVAPADEGVDLE